MRRPFSNLPCPILFARHGREVSEDLLVEYQSVCASGATVLGKVMDGEGRRRSAALAAQHMFQGGLLVRQGQHVFGPNRTPSPLSISANFRPDSLEVVEDEYTPIPLLAREPLRWFSLVSYPVDRSYWQPFDVHPFLDRARCSVEFLEAEYACMELAGNLAAHAELDPRDVQWPILVLGPVEVARVGRDRVLAAPAWRVEELSYGGVWIQAAEEPFAASEDALGRLAQHLGLRAVPRRTEWPEPENYPVD